MVSVLPHQPSPTTWQPRIPGNRTHRTRAANTPSRSFKDGSSIGTGGSLLSKQLTKPPTLGTVKLRECLFAALHLTAGGERSNLGLQPARGRWSHQYAGTSTSTSTSQQNSHSKNSSSLSHYRHYPAPAGRLPPGLVTIGPLRFWDFKCLSNYLHLTLRSQASQLPTLVLILILLMDQNSLCNCLIFRYLLPIVWIY